MRAWPGWCWLAAQVGLVAAALALGGLHRHDPLWYDECYTLEHFATGDPAVAFRDYHAANNHVLFSAGLALWRRAAGLEPAELRLLPLGLFALSIPVLMAAVRRLAGPGAAVLAAALFLASHVTLNFAAQLRGYGPSWLPLALAGWGLVSHLQRPRWTTAVAYGAAGAVAVGIVPTNLVGVGVLAAWGGLVAWRGGLIRGWRGAARWLAVLALPLAGLAAYAGVGSALAERARELDAGHPAAEVLADWLTATLRDLWWLAPLLAVGAVALLRQAGRERAWTVDSPRARLAWVAAVAVVPAAALAVASPVPFARVLVPLLPLWFAGVALLACAPLRGAVGWLANGLPLVLAAVLCGVAAWREPGAGFERRFTTADRPQTLYDLYYQHDFRPAETVTELRRLAAEQPSVVLADDTDFWALRWQIANGPPTELREKFGDYRSEKLTAAVLAKWRAEGRRLILVARSAAGAAGMQARLGVADRGPPVLLADVGRFKVFLSP